MPRQLRDMLTDLRAELGYSTNVAHGVNDRESLIYYLNRTQRQLYEDYDWPQLVVDRDIKLVPGTRYYPYPEDLAFGDINAIWVLINVVYAQLGYGIGPEDMVLWNSDTGFASWPTRKWMHAADTGMIELWPVPNDSAADPSAIIRVRGTKTVQTMVDDSDEATLPDNIVVLFSAVEILQRDG